MAENPSKRNSLDALTLYYHLGRFTSETLFYEFVQSLQLQNDKTITTLQLSAVFGSPIFAKGWTLLFQMLQLNKTIKTIEFTSCYLTSELAQLFAKTVLYNNNFNKGLQNPIYFTSITHLDLSRNRYIGFNGVYAIVDALCANPNGCTLEVLNLTDVIRKSDSDANGIMKQPLAERLVTLLHQSNSKLIKLYLSFNYLGDQFVSIFATGLKNNTQLRKLHLTNNDITNIGATAIANALVYNKTLSKLNLSCNDIADDGAMAITHTLRYHPTLLYLVIRDNKLSQDGILEASQFLFCNESINYFYWCHDEFIPNEEFKIALQSISCYNDTIQRELFVEIQHETKRTAPKKGLKRRQDMFKFLQCDWMSGTNKGFL